MRKQVKVFDATDAISLTGRINQFLKEHDGEAVDIQYQMSMTDGGGEYHSAIVIYHEL